MISSVNQDQTPGNLNPVGREMLSVQIEWDDPVESNANLSIRFRGLTETFRFLGLDDPSFVIKAASALQPHIHRTVTFFDRSSSAFVVIIGFDNGIIIRFGHEDQMAPNFYQP